MDKPALLYPVVKELNTDVASAGMIHNSLTSSALARRRSRKIYKRAASWSTSISASTAVLGAVVSATICINTPATGYNTARLYFNLPWRLIRRRRTYNEILRAKSCQALAHRAPRIQPI